MYKIKKVLLIVFLFTCVTMILPKSIQAQELEVKTSLVEDKGQLVQYVVTLNKGESALLSKDGGVATVVNNGKIIKSPGTYYMTTKKPEGTFAITTFTIPYNTAQTKFKVGSEEALREAIKQILSIYATDVTIEVTYGNYSFNDLFKHIEKNMEKVAKDYPITFYNSFEGVGRRQKNPPIRLKITYSDTGKNQMKLKDQQTQTQMKKMLNDILTVDMTDFEKEVAIVNYLANHITYAEDITPMMNHTLQGSVVDGIAVCDGYARTLMYLLNSCGVPTTMVYGTADGVPHAWNIVTIEGKKYHVDLTWADQDENHIGGIYDYINETSDYMAKTHIWDEPLPDITKDLTYSNIHIPYEEEGIYRIENQEDWKKIMEILKDDNLDESSLIFYNTSKNKWNEDLILDEITEKERAGISYMLKEKYDTLIVSYIVSD